MFDELERINVRPDVFCAYTAEDLWTDPHLSERMLDYHLDGDIAKASRTSAFIHRSLTWLTAYTDIGPEARVLDLGCGPGLYTNPLATLGPEVVGVDFSERSLRYARSTATDIGPMPTYIHGNYLEVGIPGPFDLILMVMCDYCALSPSQRRTMLDRIKSLLRPNGRFVFDVYGLRSLRDRQEVAIYSPSLMDGFWSAAPYHGFLHTFVYEHEGVILDKYEIIEPNRSRTIYNWLQHFDTAAIEHELDDCGLGIEAVLGDLAGSDLDPDPFEFCVVATTR